MASKPARLPLSTIQFLLGFIVLSLVIYILYIGANILIPFMIALFMWHLINAVARWLEGISFWEAHLPRFFCFVTTILFLVLGLWFIFHLISANIADVKAAAPLYQRHFEQIIPRVMAFLHLEQQETIREVMDSFNLGATITAFVKMFTGIAGKTLVVLFYTGFLLYEQRFFDRKLSEMIKKDEHEERVRNILWNIDVKIQRYVGVKTFVSVLTGVLTWLLLKYIDVDFNEFWGLLAFALNFIPYVGPLTAIVVPSLVALIQFGDMSVFAYVFSGLSLVQAMTGIVLDQKLMGDSLNFSPVVVISVVAMWALIWGLPGMFLAIPVLAAVMVTLSQFPSTRSIAILLSKTGELERDESAASRTGRGK